MLRGAEVELLTGTARLRVVRVTRLLHIQDRLCVLTHVGRRWSP